MKVVTVRLKGVMVFSNPDLARQRVTAVGRAVFTWPNDHHDLVVGQHGGHLRSTVGE